MSGGHVQCLQCGVSVLPAEIDRHARWHRLARRDMFAAAALTGMLANQPRDYLANDYAELAVVYADALIFALDRRAA